MAVGPILEVSIGLIFVYFILSIICSGLNEATAGVFGRRARWLERGIRSLLQDADGSRCSEIYQHPLIRVLIRKSYASRRGKDKKPSYIPARTFALAFLDTVMPQAPLAGPGGDPEALQKLERAIDALPTAHLKRTLSLFVKEAQGDVNELRKRVEQWFDDTMDRVSGWYTRQTHLLLLLWALGLAVALNVDTITLVQNLYKDPSVREAVVEVAQWKVEEGQGRPSSVTGAAKTVEGLQQLNLPLGWRSWTEVKTAFSSCPRAPCPPNPRNLDVGRGLFKIVGLLLTAAALTVGAPFWFDLLGRLVTVRSAGKRPPPPQKAEEAGGER